MHNEMHASMAGMAGNPAKVSRTIAVEMNDTMQFTPDKVSVKAGETVRFFIVNKGKVPHEMVIGTAEEIDEHAEMMKKTPSMVHKEANQITLAPGQRGGIVWQFAKAGTVTYAYLVPGHKEAGMVGTIEVN
ncbi:MAG: cupredoxin family protein [Burkholderiaceae bacterium]